MRSSIRGWQIAFLILSAGLLSVPFSRWVLGFFEAGEPYRTVAERMFIVVLGIVIVGSIPSLRRRAFEMIGVPIGHRAHAETLMACGLKIGLIFAFAGGLAVWAFASMGSESIVRMMSSFRRPEDEWAIAFSIPGIVISIVLGGVLAPVIEEIVFRGFLQGAWERRWGWFTAVTMTSLVFATFHDHFVSSFVSAVLFSCVYRRTGALRAAIAVHTIGNLVLWYPLLGQFVFPSRDRALADPSTWWLQLACLAVALVAMPFYVFLAAMNPAEEPSTTEILQQPA